MYYSTGVDYALEIKLIICFNGVLLNIDNCFSKNYMLDK